MRPDEERQGPVIRDRRRIDPVTGQVRDTGEARPQAGPPPGAARSKAGSEPGSPRPRADAGAEPGSTANDGTATSGSPAGEKPAAAAGKAPAGAEGAVDPAMAQAVDELTADLKRVQAEYSNYRKRVERDRLAVREQALANVLHGLLPVLDDIGRAREHGELTGGFKSVADSLEGIVVKQGLTAFGESGDPFDPTLHEALMHSYSADVTEPTAVQILQPGYKVGERIIRPARVAVAEPGTDAPVTDADETESVDETEPGASAGGEASAES